MDPYPSFGGGFGVSSIGSGGGSGGGSYPSGSWAIPGSAGSFGGNQAGSSGAGLSGSMPFTMAPGSGLIGSSSMGTGGVSGFSGPGGTSFSPTGGEQMPILSTGSKLSPVLESSPGSRLFLISPKRESPDPLLMNTLLLGPQVHVRPAQQLGGDSSAFQAVPTSTHHSNQTKPETHTNAYPIYNPYFIPEPAMFRSSLSPGAQPGPALLDHQHPHFAVAAAGMQSIRPAHTPASPDAMEVGGGGGNYSPEDEDDEFNDAPRMIAQHALSSSSVDSYMQPAIMYRNLFHAVECQLPALYNNYGGWRIFVDETVGYAGNAKIFKRTPDKNEQALILTCAITDPQRQELVQCSSCKEYFENRMYFKANPHIKGRIILVKNNNLIKVDNGGVFKINIKYMCCCKHHHVQYYILHLSLTDNISNNLVATATYPIYVKQWRKSTQKKQSCTIILSAAT